MKKTVSLILLTALLFTFVGCEQLPVETDPLPTETEPVTESLTETDPPETDPPETKPPIQISDVTCDPVSEWKNISLTWKNVEKAISIPFPTDFKLKKYDDQTYLILRNGIDIGDVRTGDPTTAINFEKTASYQRGDIELSYQLRRVREGSGEAFRHVFGFYYLDGSKEHALFVELDYVVLDAAGAQYICDRFVMADPHSGAPILSLEGGNSSKTILVAGNSFVGTSRVGVYFTQFVDRGNQPYNVYWNSTGYASVARTYTVGDWIKLIESGEFHAVVMCGFYGANDVTAMKTLVEACEASDTKLIMFPAHNENNTHIASAMKQYPEIPFVDWKGEINRFIADGMSKWDFCINDEHLHSNGLAGYVGAHMLYMALFGEAPPDYVGSEPHNMSYIREMLGENYIKTGMSPKETSVETVNLAKP